MNPPKLTVIPFTEIIYLKYCALIFTPIYKHKIVKTIRRWADSLYKRITFGTYLVVPVVVLVAVGFVVDFFAGACFTGVAVLFFVVAVLVPLEAAFALWALPAPAAVPSCANVKPAKSNIEARIKPVFFIIQIFNWLINLECESKVKHIK
ncbi:MAG: hypothetical protein HKL88_05685 [Bacteroidia bacterium]|nr:hypothetical protein [Bacteroidia bacterium]